MLLYHFECGFRHLFNGVWVTYFRYADLRRRLLVDPHIIDEDQTASQLRMDNPLSQDPGKCM